MRRRLLHCLVSPRPITRIILRLQKGPFIRNASLLLVSVSKSPWGDVSSQTRIVLCEAFPIEASDHPGADGRGFVRVKQKS